MTTNESGRPSLSSEGSLSNIAGALDQIERLLAAGQVEPALEALIQLWRQARVPELADLIEELSSRAARSLSPIDGRLDDAAYHRVWIERASEQGVLEVERLIPGLFRPPLHDAIIQRARGLMGRSPDPRVASALTRMIEKPLAAGPFYLSTLWQPLCGTLAVIGDVRVRPRLERCLAMRPANYPHFWAKLFELVEQALERLPTAGPRLEPVAREQVERIGREVQNVNVVSGEQAEATVEGTGTSEEERLLRLIFDAPSMNENRLVYADYLLSRGDPRGEAIILGMRDLEGRLSSVERARLHSLIEMYGVFWMGPLSAVVLPSSARFEGGFLSRAATVGPIGKALIEHAAWATIQELQTDCAELVASPHLAALRSVAEFPAPLVPRLSELNRPLGMEHIEVKFTPGDDLDALLEFPRSVFPNLRHLTTTRFDPGEGFSSRVGSSMIARQLESWRFRDGACSDPTEYGRLFQVLPRLSTLIVEGPNPSHHPRTNKTARLKRTSRGFELEISIDWVIVSVLQDDLEGSIQSVYFNGIRRILVQHTSSRKTFKKQAYINACKALRFPVEVVPPAAPQVSPEDGFWSEWGI